MKVLLKQGNRTEAFIEDTRTKALQRFFMLTFTPEV